MAKKFPLLPIADRIIVRPVTESGQTKSGLYIPENKKETPGTGTVVAVGPGRVTDDGVTHPMVISVGDQVVFSKYAPESITVDGVDYLVIREEQILARYE